MPTGLASAAAPAFGALVGAAIPSNRDMPSGFVPAPLALADGAEGKYSLCVANDPTIFDPSAPADEPDGVLLDEPGVEATSRTTAQTGRISRFSAERATPTDLPGLTIFAL